MHVSGSSFWHQTVTRLTLERVSPLLFNPFTRHIEQIWNENDAAKHKESSELYEQRKHVPTFTDSDISLVETQKSCDIIVSHDNDWHCGGAGINSGSRRSVAKSNYYWPIIRRQTTVYHGHRYHCNSNNSKNSRSLICFEVKKNYRTVGIGLTVWWLVIKRANWGDSETLNEKILLNGSSNVWQCRSMELNSSCPKQKQKPGFSQETLGGMESIEYTTRSATRDCTG